MLLPCKFIDGVDPTAQYEYHNAVYEMTDGAIAFLGCRATGKNILDRETKPMDG